jgi:hypothetical protein
MPDKLDTIVRGRRSVLRASKALLTTMLAGWIKVGVQSSRQKAAAGDVILDCDRQSGAMARASHERPS